MPAFSRNGLAHTALGLKLALPVPVAEVFDKGFALLPSSRLPAAEGALLLAKAPAGSTKGAPTVTAQTSQDGWLLAGPLRLSCNTLA